MAFILSMVALWIVAGTAIALLLGRAIKVADSHEHVHRDERAQQLSSTTGRF